MLISFFGGDRYYYDCAERLARQCETFGIEHDICELKPDAASGWLNICRAKVRFWAEKLAEHRRPVFWVDVDSQLVRNPSEVLRSGADLGGFLRNFRYLVGFDPQLFSRLIVPGYLLLGDTEKGRAFTAKMLEISRAAPENVSDDYVLHQSLLEFDQPLRIDLLPPDLVTSSNESPARERAVFQTGLSGNVASHIGRAEQHEVEALSVERRKRVLAEEARSSLAHGEREDAKVFLKRIRRVDPDDRDSLLKLLSIYEREGDMGRWRYHLDRAKKNVALRSVALRVEIERRMKLGRWGDVDRDVDELKRLGAEQELAFVESRRLRFELDRRAAEAGIADEDRPALWWWERPYPGNLGDMINPYVVEGVAGVPPRFSHASPRVIAIGSIVKFARVGDHVWGPGASSAQAEIAPEARFHAVRGPLTRDIALRAGADCPPVYGDPAWLLPKLYQPKTVAKTHRVGLIRHHVHDDLPVALGEDVLEIPIVRTGYAGIEAFLDEMARCEAILSTSLHGVIIANAYGIPAKWCVFSGAPRQLAGDGMKFEDYFRSVGRRDMRPFDLSGVDRIGGEFARLCDDVPEHAPDLDALLAAAPFSVRPELRRAS